jgi:hypothetical protein
MRGGDRIRFCARCKKHVYNLSGMTRAQAENLIQQKEGGLCVRFYRRVDGTVLTQDCLGLVATRRWVAAGLGLAGTLVVGLFASLFTARGDSMGRHGPSWAHDVEPFRTILEWIDPNPPMVMGECAPMPIPPAPGGGGGQPAPAPQGGDELPG